MKLSRHDVFELFLIVVSFLIAAGLYSRLPQNVPTHWDIHGVANGFTPKPWGAFLGPMILVVLFIVLAVLPLISPRGFRMTGFKSVFRIIRTAIISFLFIITTASLLAAAGFPLPIGRIVTCSIGLLLAVLGNYMGKLTRNFFVGIRTPWTLASDEVWLRTHRLGGVTFTALGIFLIVLGILNSSMTWMLPAIIVATVIPVVYSFVLYRRMEGLKDEPPPQNEDQAPLLPHSRKS